MELIFLAIFAAAGASALFSASGSESDDSGEPAESETEPNEEATGDILDEVAGPEEDEAGDATPPGTADRLLLGDSSSETLEGGDGADTIGGDDGDDEIFGGSGDDLLDGLAEGYHDNNQATYTWEDFAENGNDEVFGGTGDDSLGISAGDEATGGEGDDAFFVYHGEDGTPVNDLPVIHDFDAASDKLVLTLKLGANDSEDAVGQELGNGEFELAATVTSALTADGSGLILSVDGQPVVILNGVTQVDLSQIETRAFM